MQTMSATVHSCRLGTRMHRLRSRQPDMTTDRFGDTTTTTTATNNNPQQPATTSNTSSRDSFFFF